MAIDRLDISNTAGITAFSEKFIGGINVFIGSNATRKTTILKCIYAACERDKIRNSVFIPVTEMLSHSRGFVAMASQYNIPFDRTQIEILVKAQMWETREITPRNMKLLDMISCAIDGEIAYENDTFYTVKSDGLRVEFSEEAEGYKKLGLLWKLIRNGLLESGSVLLWDEPDAGINPELMPLLADILYEIKNGGVQIFLTTHNYPLAKYLDLKQQKSDDILFISLYKNQGNLQTSRAKKYAELKINSIEKADEELYMAIIKKLSEA